MPITQYEGGNASDKLRHVFVLMLENRSFDHVFGRFGDGMGRLDNLLQSGWIHRSLNCRKTGKAYSFADALAQDHVSPDPPHEMEDVYFQLTGKDPWRADGTPVLPVPYGYDGAVKTCEGFLDAYLETPDIAKLTGVDPLAVMASWDPKSAPVLTTLAREYALCDRWFSSMPGPTWPNRLFVHAGHSGGLDFSPAGPDCGLRFFVDGYDLGRTVFDQLGNRAAVYTDGTVPLVLCLKGINLTDLNSVSPVLPLGRFEEDLAAGKMDRLNYIFIEPNYGKALFTDVSDEYAGGNSQHSVASFHAGEDLVARVYNALRGSKLWPESLLVVNWDEHGGFFDHVAPPTSDAFKPRGTTEYTKHHFNFDTLGVRVPALFIGPYVRQGYVDSAVRDHSVLPNFVSEWFTGVPLPQGRGSHAEGVVGAGVTALSAASGLFDWGQSAAGDRLPEVGMAEAEPSRTIRTRAVLAALAQGKRLAAGGKEPGQADGQARAALGGLRTRADHVAFIEQEEQRAGQGPRA